MDFASGKTSSLRKAFKISRDVLTASGKWVTVFFFSEVQSRSWNLPYFECAAKLSDRTEISGSYQVTTAVRSILQSMKAVKGTTGMWNFWFSPAAGSVITLITFPPSQQKRAHAARNVNRLS